MKLSVEVPSKSSWPQAPLHTPLHLILYTRVLRTLHINVTIDWSVPELFLTDSSPLSRCPDGDSIERWISQLDLAPGKYFTSLKFQLHHYSLSWSMECHSRISWSLWSKGVWRRPTWRKKIWKTFIKTFFALTELCHRGMMQACSCLPPSEF